MNVEKGPVHWVLYLYPWPEKVKAENLKFYNTHVRVLGYCRVYWSRLATAKKNYQCATPLSALPELGV